MTLDQTRVSSIVDPSGAPHDAIVKAAGNCPTGAISVWRNGVPLV